MTCVQKKWKFRILKFSFDSRQFSTIDPISSSERLPEKGTKGQNFNKKIRKFLKKSIFFLKKKIDFCRKVLEIQEMYDGFIHTLFF